MSFDIMGNLGGLSKVGGIGSIGSLPSGVLGNIGDIAAAKAMGPVVGMIGDVVFMSSQFSIRTWQSVTRVTTANFADHAVISQKPVTEFTGLALDEMEFTIQLNSALGVEPLSEADNLRAKIASGEPQRIIMAGALLGDFTIRSMDEEWLSTRYNRPSVIELTLTCKEYIESIPTEAESKMREDELKRGETGKGGPERLPGASEKASQTRNLEPMGIDNVTRMPIPGA